jgi:hypothetical protein
MALLGVFAFGAVLGWWAVSVVAWRRPPWTVLGGVAVSILAAGWLVAEFTQPGKVVPFASAAAASAGAHVLFLGTVARTRRGARRRQA